MQELLPLFKQPSHYVGTEINSVHKDPEDTALSFGLAFPDLYEVGMSYLGQKILYKILNDRQDIRAERVFAPSLQVAETLKNYGSELSTLESDTPLNRLDILGFSLTHELCYSTLLYMLDLANIPFKARDRGANFPLLIGGGSVFNPEPIAPFFDVFLLGDGEEAILEIADVVLNSKETNTSRLQTLQRLQGLPGIYIPSLNEDKNTAGTGDVEKRVVPDLNTAGFCMEQIIPFGKPVHDRFTLEIARGCTRGCRFCQAGTTQRPVRERSLQELGRIVSNGLEQTGFEEISFLSLSTGDFSVLEALFQQSFEQCRIRQVAISLPSLRAGSLSPALMSMLSSIKRTGATIAPEAGTERLRRVINKGISEQELLEHTSSLFELGWNNIKLYFMIGHPTETWEDVRAIFELCQKVLDTSHDRKRTNITASISPFIPKPHTPFQWEEQEAPQESLEKINFLKKLFKSNKKLTLKWHDPYMSFLEGVFSRGDNKLGESVLKAYQWGDVFTSWQESFNLDIWMDAFKDLDIDPKQYLNKRDTQQTLPWEYLNLGVTRDFLLREQKRSKEAKQSPDCRYNTCQECGVCNHIKSSSALQKQDASQSISPRLNREDRDQYSEDFQASGFEEVNLGEKSQLLKLWFTKQGPAKYLSQLELQSVLERTFRRANLPVTFSRGYQPKPLVSFGRALPVGISSTCEWCDLYLRSRLSGSEIIERLNTMSIQGIRFFGLQEIEPGIFPQTSRIEEYELFFAADKVAESFYPKWFELEGLAGLPVEKPTKKGTKCVDVLPFIKEVKAGTSENSICILLDWSLGYINPFYIIFAVNPDLSMQEFELCKKRQFLAGNMQD